MVVLFLCEINYIKGVQMKKTELFKDFYFNGFWEKSEYGLDTYTEKKPSDKLIESIEKELGYKLPQSYIEMMKIHNGGTPHMSCFPTTMATSWADDHIAIQGFSAIGREKIYSLCGELGSQFMMDEWEYPNYGVIICDCPSGGHDLIMMDYRQCGKEGEPSVIHITDEHDVTFLAENFETFVRGLVNEEVYDTSEEDLKEELVNIKTGRFSTTLEDFFLKSEIDFDIILRNLFTAITNEKGFFALHADKLSVRAYDIQFYLFFLVTAEFQGQKYG